MASIPEGRAPVGWGTLDKAGHLFGPGSFTCQMRVSVTTGTGSYVNWQDTVPHSGSGDHLDLLCTCHHLFPDWNVF